MLLECGPGVSMKILKSPKDNRLEAARKRACAQGWAWADLADEEALA